MYDKNSYKIYGAITDAIQLFYLFRTDCFFNFFATSILSNLFLIQKISLHFLLVSNNCLFSDYSKGFGGKYGVQTDRKDQSAVGWDHQEKVEKHESQKGRKVTQSCWCFSPRPECHKYLIGGETNTV